ncbi:UDP-glucose 4-epimerase [Zopfia rhizophila CBS 207.26]|uniref:UDP-glucose 4-epimerase n=1 Tax=Zopfia rhizophila CBS 207.26 TaxID=1314779 RepID=A0A6A6DYA1_9PEZI|nr:UDP-glucose 4-epimerase [Zopfia rhizophila CBS 207.26]
MGSILVTGGTGYLGSFTTLALLQAGYKVVAIDNLHNSCSESLNRIELICGKRPEFYELDITDEAALDGVFSEHSDIEGVIHFAALKSVGESSEIPLNYYHVNIYGTIVLLRCMARHNVTNLVFSSSATVYGDATRFPDMIPIPEDCPREPENPYGRTKHVVELLIKDHFEAQARQAKRRACDRNGKQWNAALLRYFNPCGAHPSGIMGEDPRGGSLNLIPVLGHVAVGKLEKLSVFGDDYDSIDGTMIRDYIHVLDLADGHLAALKYLQVAQPGVRAWNLGSGTGTTVYQMLKAFSRAAGRDIPYQVVGRRAGDVLNLTARASRATDELQWTTRLTLEDACADFWRWISNNPKGYDQDPPAILVKRVQSGAA